MLSACLLVLTSLSSQFSLSAKLLHMRQQGSKNSCRRFDVLTIYNRGAYCLRYHRNPTAPCLHLGLPRTHSSPQSPRKFPVEEKKRQTNHRHFQLMSLAPKKKYYHKGSGHTISCQGRTFIGFGIDGRSVPAQEEAAINWFKTSQEKDLKTRTAR